MSRSISKPITNNQLLTLAPGASTGVTKIRAGCPAHNCWGRCLLIAHIKDGKITRLEADDRPDSLASPFGAGLASAWFPLWVLLAAEAGLALSDKNQVNETGYQIRGVCIALAMVGVSLLPLVPDSVQAWSNLPVFLLILSEQVLGRWLFYEARVPAL